MAITQDAINDALERLSSLGFAVENSFFEHGPMLAEGTSTWAATRMLPGGSRSTNKSTSTLRCRRGNSRPTEAMRPSGEALSATTLDVRNAA
jgi:hypothetical protein